MKKITLLLLLVSALCVSSLSAQVPRTISYQGSLVDSKGDPVPNGSHALTAKLYRQPSGGVAVYEESQSAAVTAGIFSMIIGSSAPIPSSLIFDSAYFLGISVDGGNELVPRVPLTAAPYALFSAGAQTANAISDTLTGVVRAINNESNFLSLSGLGSTTVTNKGPNFFIASTDTTFKIPFADTSANDTTAFSITNSGKGKAGHFEITNNTSTNDALSAITFGPGRAAFFRGDSILSYNAVLESTTNSSGLAAKFSNTNATAFAATAVEIVAAGFSLGLQVYGGGGGGWFLPSYPGGIYANSGSGFAIQGSSTSGAGVYGGASTGTGVYAQARGTGNALIAVSESGGTSTTTNGNIALFKNTVNSGNVARISNTGKGFFNGGTQASGADLAEAFAVVGEKRNYEPGDVVVIASGYKRTVAKCSSPYATNVLGVYATKPGMLLTERDGDADMSDLMPVGVIGVLPTKVTSEGGAINAGDLLVTSSKPGYAMKADPEKLKFGMSLGKALEDFDGTEGVIQVFVNAK